MQEPPVPGTIPAEEFRRIREVFEEALDRPAAERRGFVEDACAGNTVLVAEVERMLLADAAADRLLDGIAGPGAAPPATVTSTCSSCRATLAPSDRFAVNAGRRRARAPPTRGASALVPCSRTGFASLPVSGVAEWARSIAPTTSSSASRSP
jgi:hypothetical protein